MAQGRSVYSPGWYFTSMYNAGNYFRSSDDPKTQPGDLSTNPQQFQFPGLYPVIQTSEGKVETSAPVVIINPSKTAVNDNLPTPVDTFPRGRFRLIGFFLCILSACTVGFGITDVVITALGVNVQGTNWGCLDSPNPYYNILGPGVTSMQFGMWFWFSVGIWAPLTVFVAGIVAGTVRDSFSQQAKVFLFFAILSLIIFMPIALIFSIIDAILSQYCVSSTPATPQPVKLAMPVLVAIFTILEVILLIALLVTLRNQQTKELSKPSKSTKSTKVTLVTPKTPTPTPEPTPAQAPTPTPIPAAAPTSGPPSVTVIVPTPPAPPPPRPVIVQENPYAAPYLIDRPRPQAYAYPNQYGRYARPPVYQYRSPQRYYPSNLYQNPNRGNLFQGFNPSSPAMYNSMVGGGRPNPAYSYYS